MSRGLVVTILCLFNALPSVLGSAKLVPRTSSASCTGHFQDLLVTSITCDHSNSGCTYGSEVFVTGQVTSNADLPRPMVVTAKRTFPSIYGMGKQVFSGEVEDVCEAGVVTALPDDDGNQSHSCPSAGTYNFNFLFENYGSRKSWYAGWHGFTMGMAVHFKHEGGGSDYATCTINISVQGSDDSSYATNATLVSVATLGLAGLCASMFAKRRKERLARNEERTKELATHFELVNDSTSAVV
eukprot:CAMPEP_0172361294 /NCGR_PEP_ID=MMETSP1060-20121228/5146_1 /TAXON_ID=37318 /ORGANISM="Pseudo-nitzschia pungens, Strain cf. cingulata" /LENGTH=240 /DNA_ID=CAMNT_0013083515 /DNA_START=96 /DNA_END=818 /DNA_ORIENTATION=-